MVINTQKNDGPLIPSYILFSLAGMPQKNQHKPLRELSQVI